MASHNSHYPQRTMQCCIHLPVPAWCSNTLYTNHRQSGEAQSQLSAASADLEAAQVEVTQLKAEHQTAEAQAVAEAAKAEAATAVQVSHDHWLCTML